MAKSYFRLKDTGTTFYDVSQAKGLVADRVAELELTETVRKAKSRGVIVEVEEGEAKEAISKQEADFEDAEKARLANETKSEPNLDSTSAKVAINGGVSEGGSTDQMNFNDGDARSTTGNTGTDENNFNAADVLSGTVSEVTEKLAGLSTDQLNTLKKAEQEGQNRKGVISAIDEQLGTSGASSKKVNLGNV